MQALRNVMLTAMFLAPTVLAMQTAAGDDAESYIAVVTGNNVYVRSGAADSYYPFGRVNEGELVKVTGEKFNWMRVATTGPTFTPERFFGYIVYPTTQPGRFRLSADGKTGTTLGRADVLAPNLNTGYNPNDSWKPLIRLDADTKVTVLETTTTANNTVHRIVLPQDAEAWISKAYIRPATGQERQEWERQMRGDDAVVDQAPAQQPQQTPVTPADEPQTPRKPDAEPAQEQPEPAVTPVAEEAQPASREASEQAASETPVETPAQAPGRTPDQTAQPPVTTEQREAEVDDTVMPALPNVEPEARVIEEEIVEEAPARPTLAEQLADASLEDLEQAYELLRKEAIETAEVNPLREMYLRFADRSEAEDRNAAAFARARANQLELWADVQKRQNELAEIRARARITAERTEAARLAVDAGGDYIAVGRLASSTIYDGRRLPLMLRLQDPGTGRTVAYMEPGDNFDIAGMIGQLVGVVGEKSYDGGLRLNVIEPRRVDILAPQ